MQDYDTKKGFRDTDLVFRQGGKTREEGVMQVLGPKLSLLKRPIGTWIAKLDRFVVNCSEKQPT
jgi:hypothetical protein